MAKRDATSGFMAPPGRMGLELGVLRPTNAVRVMDRAARVLGLPAASLPWGAKELLTAAPDMHAGFNGVVVYRYENGLPIKAEVKSDD